MSLQVRFNLFRECLEVLYPKTNYAYYIFLYNLVLIVDNKRPGFLASPSADLPTEVVDDKFISLLSFGQHALKLFKYRLDGDNDLYFIPYKSPDEWFNLVDEHKFGIFLGYPQPWEKGFYVPNPPVVGSEKIVNTERLYVGEKGKEVLVYTLATKRPDSQVKKDENKFASSFVKLLGIDRDKIELRPITYTKISKNPPRVVNPDWVYKDYKVLN